ncbi:MAG: SDR family NAD(P)-dependent oxidoreductase [Ignavibacteria bacterium]|nr:SDR family NAD(P)-dependent oxidoreductase [Ignavibacteria bacterium]
MTDNQGQSVPQRVFIIGATSAIAKGVALLYAARNSRLFLVGRNQAQLTEISAELLKAGAASVAVFVADLRDKSSHDEIVRIGVEKLGGLDVAMIAHGKMADQDELSANPDLLIDSFITNGLSVLSLSQRLAIVMKANKSGVLALFSSVAGERGRKSNYVYGASKAAITAYSSGLRAELKPSGVHVLTIKPGVVDTPMTASKKAPFKAKVEKVSIDIIRAIDAKKNILYTPWYWRWIMLVVKMIPEKIFMKTNF